MEVDDLVYLGQQLTRIGRMAMHAATPDLQAAESMVVGELLEKRFSTITELVGLTGYAQSRISKAVAVLREQGIVGTRTDPDDRRRSVVYLVDADRSANRKVHDSADELIKNLLPDADAGRRQGVVDALAELTAALRGHRAAAADASDVLLRRWADELNVPKDQLNRMSSAELLALVERRRAAGGDPMSADGATTTPG